MINERKRKISIIGAGFVGATTAYALMNSGIATEICIYDINMDKALGEVMDLVHGTSFVKPVNIYTAPEDFDAVHKALEEQNIPMA